MYVKEIYETVSETEMCSEGKFLSAVDMAVRTLEARYGSLYVQTEAETYRKPKTVDEDMSVFESYYPAIVQYVLFKVTGDADRYTDFLGQAEFAYKSVWARKHRKKRMIGW